MPDSVVDALLVVVAIAYLGGAILMVVALVKVLVAWSPGRTAGAPAARPGRWMGRYNTGPRSP